MAVGRWQHGARGREVYRPIADVPLGSVAEPPLGASVAHEPDIPVTTVGEMGGGTGIPGMERRGMEMRGMEMRGGMELMLGGRRATGLAGSGAPATEGTPFGDNRTGAADPGLNTAPGADGTLDESRPPKYLLFRFFDFSVQPGKQYVYRVRLALQNPNREVKGSLLKNPEVAKETYLKTNWSDPSPVISVPRNTRILAASVKPARGSIEPSGKIRIAKWVQRKGIEVSEEFSVKRGDVANFSDVTIRPAGTTVGGGRTRMGELGGGATMAAAGGAFKVNFLTGSTIVDVRGGEHLPGRAAAP